ncbi:MULTISPECIES: hypothetical protein [unclassified Kribbella]
MSSQGRVSAAPVKARLTELREVALEELEAARLAALERRVPKDG